MQHEPGGRVAFGRLHFQHCRLTIIRHGQFKRDRSEFGKQVIDFRDRTRPRPLGGQSFKQVQFISPFENQQMPGQADKLGAGPVVRHITGNGLSFALWIMFLAPAQQR